MCGVRHSSGTNNFPLKLFSFAKNASSWNRLRSPAFTDQLQPVLGHAPPSFPVDQEPEEPHLLNSAAESKFAVRAEDQAHETFIAIGLIILIGNQADKVTRLH